MDVNIVDIATCMTHLSVWLEGLGMTSPSSSSLRPLKVVDSMTLTHKNSAAAPNDLVFMTRLGYFFGLLNESSSVLTVRNKLPLADSVCIDYWSSRKKQKVLKCWIIILRQIFCDHDAADITV